MDRSVNPGKSSGEKARDITDADVAGAGPGARDVEFDVFVKRSEYEYGEWWSRKQLLQDLYRLSEDSYWNSYICLLALAGIVHIALQLHNTMVMVLDTVYNVSYGLHVFGLTYNSLLKMEATEITFLKSMAFLVDMATYSHYVSGDQDFKLLCYYLRLHRPFSYLWALKDKNLKSSVLGTALKFFYIFLVMRITWALLWLNIDSLERSFKSAFVWDRALNTMEIRDSSGEAAPLDEQSAMKFLCAFYLINKMYIPIGPSVPPANDVERITCLAIMLSGCLAVTAFAVASLSLVISLYMRPEETFRARYALIIKEMRESHIPWTQRERVQTFYKMYWHKHRAVSTTGLLPLFPRTLPATIYADIYFEAMQKSRILCDLSYQFLSELSKKMETIHYIPGDAIIKRQSMKAVYYFITYGDVELVTAEDESTAILRLTRGSVLTPCAVCAPAGLGTAHLEVRAATFCTAHVLKAVDLWKVVIKHGRTEVETDIILRSYKDHMERVKTHFMNKKHDVVMHLSSIFHLKRCLMALKEAKDANGELLLGRTDLFLEVAGCYIMRNRSDSTLTDESDAICLQPKFPYILQPASSLLVAWNLLVSCLIVIVCFAHPYYLVFAKAVPIEFRFFDYLITAVFILDLIVYLSTGANVEEGVPINFTQTSAQQMRSLWFGLDVLATAPIFEFIGSGHFAGINKILRLPRVFRFFKELEEMSLSRFTVMRFMSYTLLLLIACYLIGALQQAFMCYEFGHCVVTNLTHSPYWTKGALDDDTVGNRVAFAMYWAMSMIVFTAHMETAGTDNWHSVLYTLCVLEVCIVLRIFVEAVYSATILVTTALREDYDACIAVVKSFLIRNQVDPILRQRFISYLQLCWYTDKAYSMTNKKSIFYDLPPHVYQDIVTRQRSKYILSLPFMRFVDKKKLKDISSRARLFYTSPNEILVNTGDISNEMYVIKQGICEILSPDTLEVIQVLKAKSHFGVLVCLLRIPAFYTIRTVTNVQVVCISRKSLLEAIEVPPIRDALNFVKAQPEFRKLLVRREPFVSYVPPPPIPNRELFPLPRKHESDAHFLMPFYRLGFFSILRYIFPRYTIRPDGSYLMRYEWFRATCAFTSAMVFPSYTYLAVQWPWMYYIAYLLDILALLDIFQRMLIAYYNEDGILVYHPASTASYYLKGAFLADLFGCLPLEQLENPFMDNENRLAVTQMEQFLMMNRLIQLYRLPGAMLVLRKYIERRDILLVFKAIPLFMVTLNVLTSFMVLFSVTIYEYTDTHRWDIVPFADKGGSWVELFAKEFRFNLTESPFHLHLGTYFWMLYETSTTGYNNIKPSNVHLIRLLYFGMLFSAMMITYFSVRIISIRANVNKDLAEFQEHMKDMLAYMGRENMPQDLQKLVSDYYEYTWDKMGGVDYRNMFKLCDQITLRTDAILHIYGPTFAKCPILNQSDVSLLRIVGRAVHSAYFLRGMNVIEANDVISDMYFVDYGGVDAIEHGDHSTLTKLPKGSVFGNLDGLPTELCPLTFVATSRVHLLRIDSSTFHTILKDFPAVKQLMKKFRIDENYILGNVGESGSSLSHHQQNYSSPFVVTSRKGLTKRLYFQDKYVQIILIVVSLLCVYLDVYNAGFQSNTLTLIIVLYTLDVCFYSKILLQVLMPLIVDSVNIRRLLMPQRKAYFKGEFKYDVMSVMPIEVLCLTTDSYRMVIFSVLRLNRMFRIVTVYNSLKRHQERVTVNLVLATGFETLIWFALFVHCTSCIWQFIARVEEWREPHSSWIYKDDGSSWCQNEYICSVYFVLTTFTQNGVGDIMPRKQSEVLFTCVLMILSTMMYMIYVGEFSNIIQHTAFRSTTFYSSYLELQDFLKNNRVSRNLVELVNQYSLHMWRETRGLQEPHFLSTAPRALRLQVMCAGYLHHLNRHHVFENCEPAFLRQLVGCLRLMTYNEDMYVVKSSEITDSMYLIHKGKIEEIANESHKVPRIYPSGSYFGVMQGLMHDLPFTHSYRTLIKSQVLTLRLDDWFYLMKHYPASREAISQHMKYQDSGTPGGGSGGRGGGFGSGAGGHRTSRGSTIIFEFDDKDAPSSLDDQRQASRRYFSRESKNQSRRKSQLNYKLDNLAASKHRDPDTYLPSSRQESRSDYKKDINQNTEPKLDSDTSPLAGQLSENTSGENSLGFTLPSPPSYSYKDSAPMTIQPRLNRNGRDHLGMSDVPGTVSKTATSKKTIFEKGYIEESEVEAAEQLQSTISLELPGPENEKTSLQLRLENSKVEAAEQLQSTINIEPNNENPIYMSTQKNQQPDLNSKIDVIGEEKEQASIYFNRDKNSKLLNFEKKLTENKKNPNVLRELLANVSDTSVASEAQHMVTLNMSKNIISEKDQASKAEQKETGIAIIDISADAEKEEFNKLDKIENETKKNDTENNEELQREKSFVFSVERRHTRTNLGQMLEIEKIKEYEEQSATNYKKHNMTKNKAKNEEKVDFKISDELDIEQDRTLSKTILTNLGQLQLKENTTKDALQSTKRSDANINLPLKELKSAIQIIQSKVKDEIHELSLEKSQADRNIHLKKEGSRIEISKLKENYEPSLERSKAQSHIHSETTMSEVNKSENKIKDDEAILKRTESETHLEMSKPSINITEEKYKEKHEGKEDVDEKNKYSDIHFLEYVSSDMVDQKQRTSIVSGYPESALKSHEEPDDDRRASTSRKSVGELKKRSGSSFNRHRMIQVQYDESREKKRAKSEITDFHKPEQERHGRNEYDALLNDSGNEKKHLETPLDVHSSETSVTRIKKNKED